MLASSNYCVSDQFSDVIGLHSQLKDKLYIYIYIYILKERFIGYHILFTKHKKTVSVFEKWTFQQYPNIC